MKREQMVGLLRQAGFNVEPSAITGRPRVDDRYWHSSGGGMAANPGYQRPELIDYLERFAALVAAHEREQCALVCEIMKEKRSEQAADEEDEQDRRFFSGEACGAGCCAADIRARGKVTPSR